MRSALALLLIWCLMADTLAELLAAAYGGGPRAPEKTYGPFGEEYNVEYVAPPPLLGAGARFGFRGMPSAPPPRGPWTPPERAPSPVTREWKQSGDDSVGQQIGRAHV